MANGNTIRRQAKERHARYVNGMTRSLVALPDIHVLEVIGGFAEGVVEGSQPRAAVLALIEQGFIHRKRCRGRLYMLLITETGRKHLHRQKPDLGEAV